MNDTFLKIDEEFIVGFVGRRLGII